MALILPTILPLKRVRQEGEREWDEGERVRQEGESEGEGICFPLFILY